MAIQDEKKQANPGLQQHHPVSGTTGRDILAPESGAGIKIGPARSANGRHFRISGGLDRNAQAVTDLDNDDAMTSSTRRRRWPLALLLLIVLALPAAIGLHEQQQAPKVQGPVQQPAHQPQRAKAHIPVPAVEPMVVKLVAPQQARVINAAIPFSALPNLAAKPFKLKMGDLDLDRATDCLAAAQWYEAGDDPVGQRAVAQVVLNRVRHPAFPKTVCGVVFQGSERATGCQFTFTCDGALARTPSAAAWDRARLVAREALSGSVYSKVGTATHYHTDWVVPYWSSSLDKVSAVGTHLFFRWKGWWGTPAAFKTATPGKEPKVALIARLSRAHATSTMDDPELPLTLATATVPRAARFTGPITPVSAGQRFGQAEVVAVSPDGTSFILASPRSASADSLQSQALKLCGGRQRCRVLAWTDAARTPGGFPIMDGLLDAMAYSYMRGEGIERSLWNCEQHPRGNKSQCMIDRNPVKVAFGASGAAPPSAQLK